MTDFTAYPFRSSGIPVMCPGPNACERTRPDRISDIKNVIEFGADPTGLTDSWAAIQAAYDWTVSNNRSTVYFPPGGTYLVSQSINMSGQNEDQRIIGYGATITGNFPDAIIKRASLIDSGSNTFHIIEGLTIINTHASGTGIRWGNCIGGAIRDCNITANTAINTNDIFNPTLSSFELSIKNCTASPGSNVSGSIGLTSISNSIVANCRFVGFELGLKFYGNEGFMYVAGCHFERNIVGMLPGPGMTVSGCTFKDNGIGISFAGGGRFSGIRIDASESITVGGARPQYGIKIDAGGFDFTLLSGILVTGQYDQYGIYIEGGEQSPLYSTFIGVRSVNTSTHGGLAWRLPSTAGTAQFIECNAAPVFTMATLPTLSGGISAGSWAAAVIWELGAITAGSGYVDGTYNNVPLTGGSGTGAVAQITVSGGQVIQIDQQFSGTPIALYPPTGTNYAVSDALSASNANLGGSGSGFSVVVSAVKNTATVTTSSLNLSPFQSASVTLNINIQGVTPAQYNGVYAGAFSLGVNTIAYATVANPGGNVTVAGTVIINPVFHGAPNAQEGDSYNVSNSNVSTWGSNPVGGGSIRGKVRWGNGGTNWTLVGK